MDTTPRITGIAHTTRTGIIAHATVTLRELLQAGVGDLVHEVPALDPACVEQGPIVGGGGELLDGFHRTAGMIRWAREHGQDLDEVWVDVIVLTIPGWVGVVADGWHRHNAAAVRAVYDRAY